MTLPTDPEIRVFHRAAGWVLPDFTDLADCTTNFHRQQDGRPACTATAVWKVVEDHGLHLTIGFYCDSDLPVEHRPALRMPAADGDGRVSVLPIGTRVWVAQAACPAIGRRSVSGDGVVTGHVPCSPCWQRHLGSGRHVTRAGYRAAAEACTEPSGFVVSLGRIPIAVTDDDPTVIAVPITSDERSAA